MEDLPCVLFVGRLNLMNIITYRIDEYHGIGISLENATQPRKFVLSYDIRFPFLAPVQPRQ